MYLFDIATDTLMLWPKYNIQTLRPLHEKYLKTHPLW